MCQVGSGRESAVCAVWKKGHSFSGEMVGSGIPFRGSLPSRKGIFPSGDIGMGNVSGKFLLQVYKQCPRRRQCWITIF